MLTEDIKALVIKSFDFFCARENHPKAALVGFVN
jgi:hypothetical protein